MLIDFRKNVLGLDITKVDDNIPAIDVSTTFSLLLFICKNRKKKLSLTLRVCNVFFKLNFRPRVYYDLGINYFLNE